MDNAGLLYFVDAGFGYIDPTVVHKMNVITGDYLIPVRLKKPMFEVAEDICKMIVMDRPDKIIFERKSGAGIALYDAFTNISNRIKDYYDVYEVNSFGLVIYKE